MKKSQIEMVGLLIIVILLIFILIFFLRLGGCQQRSTIIEETRTTIEANNLLIAMMETITKYNKPMFRVIVDCYDAGANSEYCIYAKTEIQKIINLAFEKEPEYKFTLFVNDIPFSALNFERGNCEFGKTANYFRKANNINFNIMLKLCD